MLRNCHVMISDATDFELANLHSGEAPTLARVTIIGDSISDGVACIYELRAFPSGTRFVDNCLGGSQLPMSVAYRAYLSDRIGDMS